jgi:predicted DNA-binding transcriptional regulator AlpA
MKDDQLMSTKQVSAYMGVAVSTLIMYRAMGEGPPYIKIMRRMVRYRKGDLDIWLAAQTKLPQPV